MIKRHSRQRGFTLIELMVVISIITFIASNLLVAFHSAILKGRATKVKADLSQISKAVSALVDDTGLWPYGCVPEATLGDSEGASNEITLSSTQSGLITKPTVGVTDPSSHCAWTQAAVNAWRGPYLTGQLLDPWGSPYWMDEDYWPYRDCPTANANPGAQLTAALVSIGQDKIPLTTNVYNCDDSYLLLPAH